MANIPNPDDDDSGVGVVIWLFAGLIYTAMLAAACLGGYWLAGLGG